MSTDAANSPYAKRITEEIESFAKLLTDDSKSIFAKAAAVNFFRRIFTNVSNISQLPLSVFESPLQELLHIMGMNNGVDPALRTTVNSMRLDASWALTNAVCISAEICHFLVQNGICLCMVMAASACSRSSELKMQCLWVIGNIAADCDECKMMCRESGVPQLLVSAICTDEFRGTDDLKNVMWCALNIFRGGINTLPIADITNLTGACLSLIRRHHDKTPLLKDCIWTIAGLADDLNNGFQTAAVTRVPGLIDEMMRTMNHYDHNVRFAALRVIGNIATGNDLQTAMITDHPQFLRVLVKAFKSNYIRERREAAWVCSNVAAGTNRQAEMLVSHSKLFQMILKGTFMDDSRLRKECHWTILNLVSGSSEERRDKLIDAGVIHSFRDMISSSDVRIVVRSLHVLRNVLEDYPFNMPTIFFEKWMSLVNTELLEIEPEIRQVKDEIERLTTTLVTATPTDLDVEFDRDGC